MRTTKFRACFGLLIVLVLLTMSCIGFVFGKYITTIENNNVVTFTAELADLVELRESQVMRNEDGTYSKTNVMITNQKQKYVLIPGLDVPKDPHIVIQGKSEIPAYLFIEVIDNTANEALRYQLTSEWIACNLRPVRNKGAALYVYSNNDSTPTEIVNDYEKIGILNNEVFYVNQGLKWGESSNALTFYAYLEEAAICN